MAVISRSDWGAGRHKAPEISIPVSRLFLHHTVTPEWLGVEAARNLQDIARQRGFIDISYSWGVDVKGNLIEMRGWGRQGAHTKGYNSSSHAIVLIGNFQTKEVPRAMLLGAAELVRRHDRYGPDRITNGHRDVGQTACPGNKGYAAIPVINALARENSDTPKDDDVTKADKKDIVNMLLDALADKDNERAEAARIEIGQATLYRIRHDQVGVANESKEEKLNLITRIDRVGQLVRDRTG